jgi:uncharacterized protein (TIGR03067 family)
MQIVAWSADLSYLRSRFNCFAAYSTLDLNRKSNYNVAMSMRSCSLFVGLLLIGSLMVAGEQKVDGSKDLKQLQGTWRLVAGEIGGRKMTAEEIQKSKLVFRGDHYTVRRGNGPKVTGSVVVDPTKDPKTIDIIDADGPDKGKMLLGIYALDGNELKECFAAAGGARPTKFGTQTGTTQFFHVWKNVKTND